VENALILLPVFLAHLPLVIRFARITLRGNLPRVVDFAAMGIVLYFDLGLIIELAGVEYANPILQSFFMGDDSQQLLIILILIVAPYLYYLGAQLTDRGASELSQKRTTELNPERRMLFYLIILVVALSMGWWGFQFYAQNPLAIRPQLRQLGLPLNFFLLIPASLLAFYVRQRDATTRLGTIITMMLLLASMMAVLPLSSRTSLLLPVLIVMLFWARLSPVRLAIFLVFGAALALVLIPFYYEPGRWGRAVEFDEVQWQSQLQHIVFQDLYRAHVTMEVVKETELLDTDVLLFPMSGYVYGLLYFVPRSIAPFKGYSTAIQFAADQLGYELGDPAIFGYGNSAIDEILLNGGFLFLIPGLIFYGMVMGFFDRLSRQIPSLVVPTRLAALWSGGYVISVLVHLYGGMFLLCLIFHFLFVRRVGDRSVRASEEQRDLLPAQSTE
jgi:hypothetical protein